MENIKELYIKDAIELKEKNIRILEKVYISLQNELENNISSEDAQKIKYNMLVIRYTLNEEFNKKKEYNEFYNMTNNKMVIYMDYNNSLQNELQKKLDILNIYINNSVAIDKAIENENTDLLIKKYNFKDWDIKLIKFIIKNYKNDNNQKKIK